MQSRISELAQFEQVRTQAEKDRRDFEALHTHANAEQTSKVVPVTGTVKHPLEANGPKRNFIGVIHEVTCSYPTVLEFRVQGTKDAIKVYSNDFSKITLTAIGFTPSGPVNPCSDFDGMKARVQYAETADKTIDGQVSAVELRKWRRLANRIWPRMFIRFGDA